MLVVHPLVESQLIMPGLLESIEQFIRVRVAYQKRGIGPSCPTKTVWATREYTFGQDCRGNF